MSTINIIKDKARELGTTQADALQPIRSAALASFDKLGVPAVKHEEWKYTRISQLFNQSYKIGTDTVDSKLNWELFRLPEFETANELVFINGVYNAAASTVRSAGLVVLPLEEAAKGEYASIVSKHLGHSAEYLKDGINALNTSFLVGGVFIGVNRSTEIEHPVYIYTINDGRAENVFAQPRTLIHVAANAGVTFVETYGSIGHADHFTNQVMEVVVEQDARIEYYKIQNDHAGASLVSTTHFRQVGKSYVHAVTISLNGAMVRNNLNMVMEAEYCESNMYGLYFTSDSCHVDNHTIVDNAKPHCLSNEYYKGILDGASTGVFNGKIFVRQDAQKINAFQSNKNILLSDTASVYTKPQLEIFADDVKCSHGCTIGRLDEEGLFYLRSRGITEATAKSLLLHSFAVDILEQVKPDAIRVYIDQLISERLGSYYGNAYPI